jgi:DNA-binding beta-propeller fold protein YncE
VRASYCGLSVEALCVTDAPGRAFVAGGGDMMAVDAGSDQLRGVWTDNCFPIGLFADSAHGKLYCLSEWPALVCVIDPVGNSVLARLPLPGYPETVAFNPVDHKVYVAAEDYEEEEGVIAVIDAVGDTTITDIALEHTPDFLAYDPDDDLLFAGRRSSDYVLTIDGKTDRVVDSEWVSEPPVGLLYNESRHRLYSFGQRGEVTVLTPRAHRQDNYILLDDDLDCFVLDVRGEKLYAGNSIDSVFEIDCVGESLAGVIPVPAPPVAFSYDALHDQLYVAYGEEGGGVSVIDCSQRSVRATVPLDADSLYWDAGTDAVYCFNDTCLAVVDGGTRRVVARRRMGWPTGAASAPGWPRVYVANYDEPYLTVIRADKWSQLREPADVRATVVRGSMVWTGTPAAMYDKCGRRVADVHRGGNDVSRLRPGVYFVRQNGVPRGTYARKVVITG